MDSTENIKYSEHQVFDMLLGEASARAGTKTELAATKIE